MNWSDKEKKNEVLILILLNISALCYLVFILLGIIVPLAVWIFTRERYMKVNEAGKKLLNFQITWCLFIGYLMATIYIGPIFHLSNGVDATWTFLFMVLLSGINIIFIIINTIRCYFGMDVFYPALWLIR